MPHSENHQDACMGACVGGGFLGGFVGAWVGGWIGGWAGVFVCGSRVRFLGGVPPPLIKMIENIKPIRVLATARLYACQYHNAMKSKQCLKFGTREGHYH